MFHSTLCASTSIWCSEIRKAREVYKMCLMAHVKSKYQKKMQAHVSVLLQYLLAKDTRLNRP